MYHKSSRTNRPISASVKRGPRSTTYARLQTARTALEMLMATSCSELAAIVKRFPDDCEQLAAKLRIAFRELDGMIFEDVAGGPVARRRVDSRGRRRRIDNKRKFFDLDGAEKHFVGWTRRGLWELHIETFRN